MIFIEFFCFAISILFLAISFYNFYIWFGFRKSNIKKTNGYLKSTNLERNVYKGRFNGRWYKHYTNYVYSYRVNNQEYNIADGTGGTKGILNYTVKIIYQKNKPQRAYIKGLTIPFCMVISIPMLVVGTLIFVLTIFV